MSLDVLVDLSLQFCAVLGLLIKKLLKFTALSFEFIKAESELLLIHIQLI